MDRSKEGAVDGAIAEQLPRDGAGSGSGSGSGPDSGSDFLQLRIAGVPVGGRADWLAGELRRAIADGRLPVGSRLPATRVLAAELRVSRGLVTEAYQRLREDGQVAGRGRGGTVVVAAPLTTGDGPTGVPALAGAPPATHTGATAPRGTPFAAPFAAPPRSDIFDALRATPARIDLTPGVPDLASFPRAAWLRAERAVLTALPSSAFGYGDPRGAPELRRAVVHWLARNRGIRADPADVLIVSGTAQALGLVTQVLRADGIDAIAVEDPGSLGARQHLHHWGAATPPVPVDEDGVRVDALRASGVRAALLTPAHQFPTGVVLDGARRRDLLRWARDTGGLIIEDDYDAEHRYDRPPVPALHSLLADHVCYAGSVSKLLAPALRVGWLLAPPRYREALADAKRFADLGNATLPQLVLARLMETGELERLTRQLRRRHRARRDAVIAAVRAHLPEAVVHGAAAGLHLTLTFPPAVPPDTELAATALARGVKLHPLSWHSQRPYGRPGLVLGYAARTPGELTEGVAILSDALHAASHPGTARPNDEPMAEDERSADTP
ncbi:MULTISPECIES: PLP-dependent aminotransferase family protein [unclassified Streptomyces]|uniref:MocR-like pyridoxine biosynthesis transcription factor PdxR n=1 Tax=unclassified Streptomyces TaxID=2593676 RepID=UPI000998B6ED|nr:MULTISPECIES: PLP-dependent aminotransferase family protein [unclassified Streptomyces]MYT31954.1 aminotransferase class I/II-fold pyridoxal phosphate-dependent enzyme [Streptomyces sp. SID8354]